MNDRRAAVSWLGAPVGIVLLWLISDALATGMPGTALVLGLVALAALAVCLGLWFLVFHE